MSALRLPLAGILAILLAGSLFWALRTLIGETVDVGELRQATRIDFTRMRRDTEVQTKRDEKIERERPPVQPELPQMSLQSGNVENNVAMLTPNLDPRSAMQGMKLSAGSDRDVIPLVRISPDYPQRALSRGIEGWVLVRFTITAAGTVKDAKVIDAQPKNIFDDAALKAIARWRYNPKVEEGVAVERIGVQTIIRFQLEDGKA
jgi:protein TonB